MHSSTGKAPYEVIKGHTLPTPVMKLKEKVFAADEFVKDMDSVYKQVKEKIQKSVVVKQKYQANKHRCNLRKEIG